MRTYYVDGRFVSADQAVIPVDDLAVLRGLGVFELMRTFNGRPFALMPHIDRLIASAEQVGLGVPWDRNQLADIVCDTVQRNLPAELNIRVVVTGGSSPDFMTPQGKPRLLVLVTPLPKLPDRWYEKGIKVITVLSERSLPGAKSINYIPATLAMKTAREQSADEAIYTTREGRVLEGTSSNIFIFKGDRLITPEKGILSGITRSAVLSLAKPLFEIETRDVSLSEFLAADEVFITGTNKGIVPVVKVDDTIIGDGMPGSRTRKLMARLIDHTTKV
jgi:branched-chain amino acid aminotransferase